MGHRFKTTLVLSLLVLSCSSKDSSTGVTSNGDYTLTVVVSNRNIRVGDSIPVNVQLRRTDNSNLPSGLKGIILLTASDNGLLAQGSISIDVVGNRVQEVSENITFTALKSGVAEVRAAFQDAQAKVDVIISSI